MSVPNVYANLAISPSSQVQPSRIISLFGENFHLDMPLNERVALYIRTYATPGVLTGATFGGIGGAICGGVFSSAATLVSPPLLSQMGIITIVSVGGIIGAMGGYLGGHLFIEGQNNSLDWSPISNPEQNQDLENPTTNTQLISNRRSYQLAQNAWKIATFFYSRNAELY